MSEQAAEARGAAGAPMPRELNLGCGLKPRDDCLNVDRVASVRPDPVWDLDRYPYPLPESHFRRIYAFDVVEHVESVLDFMREAHRLAEPGGIIEITTPHFSCANSFLDPTHRHHLSYFSFDIFTRDSAQNFYSEARFEIVERQIVFQHTLVNRIVARLARRYPERYEQRFAWMFPAWFLIFRLRKV